MDALTALDHIMQLPSLRLEQSLTVNSPMKEDHRVVVDRTVNQNAVASTASVTKVSGLHTSATVNSINVSWSGEGFAPGVHYEVMLAVLVDPTNAVIQGVDSRHITAPQTCTFHYLPDNTLFVLLVEAIREARRSGPSFVFQKTLALPVCFGPSFVYIGPEHTLGPWIQDCPSEYMWTTCHEYEFVISLLRAGLFFLDEKEYALAPNPSVRYVLPLNATHRRWQKCKKVRKYAKDFTISVNYDFMGALQDCKRYHEERHGQTWITDYLISTLDRIRQDDSNGIRMCVFELWEGDELAAASFGYGIGTFFADFTFCTLKRDSRSVGNILTHTLGDLLTKAGYTHWYWGFALAYMRDYEPYGGTEISRKEFYRLFEQPAGSPVDPAVLVANDQTLVSAKPLR